MYILIVYKDFYLEDYLIKKMVYGCKCLNIFKDLNDDYNI